MTISKVQPDFQHLFNALRAKLQSKQSWIDVLPTSVGTTILDTFAGSAVSNQYYLDVNLREAFLPLAVRDSSIFSGTRMLGVNISRKVSASFEAQLSNYGLTTKFVSPLSVFDVGGMKAFTRGQYTIPPGHTISNVNLYIGEPNEKVFQLNTISNLKLKEFVLGVPGFVVSSNDLLVFTRNINNGTIVQWEKTDKALFEHTAADYVYFESTTRDGDVSLLFGDGQFGRELSTDEELVVQYVITNGSEGNKGLPGLKVRNITYTDIQGTTSTAINGGADEKSAFYYKMFAPHMHRTKRRAISKSDIRSIIMDYPGIADVSIFGQRDIAPNDPRWKNMIRLCVLPENEDDFGGANPNPNSAQWQQLIDTIQPKLHSLVEIQNWNPKKLFVRIVLRIALLPSASEGEIQIAATEAILKLFQKKPGILGRRLAESDISAAIRKIVGVDYVIVDSPTQEIEPSDASEYVVLEGIPDISTFYSERILSV